MEIDYRYIRFVCDYMPVLLPKPTKKIITEETHQKAETLEELGIVTIDTGVWSC